MKQLIGLSLLFLMNLLVEAQQIEIESPLKMLALGDSYTIGESVEVEKRWPHQFVARLRDRGVTAHTPDYIAQTGWTTGNLLAGIESQFDEDQDYNLVSILIGVNNQYRGLPISSYEPELLQIVEFALGVVDGDTSRLLMLSIPDYAFTPFGGGSNTISEEIDDYNRINEGVAARYGIRYVDITPISREGLEKPALVATDGLHPSGQQYSLWVDIIMPYVTIEDRVSGNGKSTPKELMIFPNPSSSKVQIVSDIPLKKVRLFNTSGRLMHETDEKFRTLELDLSQFARGTYLLEARDATRSIFRPIVLL